MAVRNRTPHAELLWLHPADIGADLDITRQQATRLIKRIPGAELLYRYEGRKGERWRVSREAYDAWKLAHQRASKGEPTRPIVYFIQYRDQPDAPVKIGFTTTRNLAARLSCIQVSNPYPLAVIATMPGDERTEQQTHERFHEARMLGEWFEMTPDLRAFIASVTQ